VKIYVASKARHAEFWAALRSAGLPISSSWVDWPGNRDGQEPPSPDAWRRHWDRCITEAADADIVLFYAAQDERQCGALIEIGAALSAGKQVFVVSPYAWTFAHHLQSRTFAAVADAVAAITAMVAGERARRAA
jgi:hypothetical protein